MEAGGDPVGWGRYRMGILDWVNKREGLTGFCGWPGPTSLQELPGGWEGTPNYPKVGKGPQAGESLQHSRGREGPRRVLWVPEGRPRPRARPFPRGRSAGPPGAELRGPRCAAIGWRRPAGIGHAGHARSRHWPARRGRHGNRAWRGGSAPRKRSHGGGGGGSVADAADGGGAGGGRRLGLGATAQQVRG